MGNKVGRIGPRKGSNPAPVSTRAMGMKERDYQAEDDARTLARAQEIKSDSRRSSAAGKAAGRLLEEKTKEVQGLRSIARRGR